jgi:hypothetical protein
MACIQENVPIIQGGTVTKKLNGKKIYMRDLKTYNVIKIFEDQSDAGR